MALEASRDWLTTVTPSQWLEREPPIGRVYVPTSSYAEMGEWALPPEETLVFSPLLHRAVAERLARGPLAARRVLAQLPGQVPRDQRPPQADAADVGEGGGDADGRRPGARDRPPPPGPVERLLLARAVRRDLHLAHAPRDLRAPDRGRGRRGPRARRADAGRRCGTSTWTACPRCWLSDEGQVVAVKPGEGGGIGGWDIRAARHAMAAALRRRPEAYHETLRRARGRRGATRRARTTATSAGGRRGRRTAARRRRSTTS